MVDHLYEPAAYDAASLDGCYWASTIEDSRDYPQIAGEQRAEFTLIGAGFAGLSAALHLAQSGADMAIVDMHRPG